MSVSLTKRFFNVDEFHRMGASNLFEGERVELVEGEVVSMAPKGSRHAACVTRLNHQIVAGLPQSFLVRVQDPLVLSEKTEFEPDIAIVRSKPDFYAGAHPTATDVVLVIEVAETSIRYDREVKLPLYAQAGVPEVWLVDLQNRVVSVHSAPSVNGYERVEEKRAGDALEPFSAQLELKIDDILG